MSLDKIKAALLSSYLDDGGINHLDGANLPSQESVDDLASDLMHLAFPGFFERSTLRQEDLPAMVDTRIRNLKETLTPEIRKCLVFAKDKDPEGKADAAVIDFLRHLPAIRRLLQTDVEAAYLGDPAAASYEEIILAYPCILAIALQRMAHRLYHFGVPLLPRMLTEYAHRQTGIDMHPGATLGSHFFIDHGTGVVIGETTSIGSHVKLYQGVTLGAKSFKTDQEGNPVKGVKRHPDIEDNVTIYAGATILGGRTRIGANSIVGSNVWLMDSVPPNSVVHYRGENLEVRQRKEKEKAEGSA